MPSVGDKLVNVADLAAVYDSIPPAADLSDVLSYLSTSDPYSIDNSEMIATLAEVQAFLGMTA